jgi:endopeptidase La
MFPMEFDHRVLESLPLPDEESIKQVLRILKTIAIGRVMPYFRNKRGTDPTLISRISERFTIERLEDEGNRIRVTSLAFKKDTKWVINIHERVFDYFAFVMPSDPESRLGGKTSEEGKILAFAEFFLRHEIEHMLYPQESEREVIRSDVVYAMDRRNNDPTFYSMLRNVLADEMTGLKGEIYLSLFDSAERERIYEYLITRILTSLVIILGDMPEEMLRGIFLNLDTDLKTKVLGECYRRSRDASYSLVKRTSCLQEVLQLFALVMEQDEKEAEKAFDAFKDRWGLIYLFHELNIPETSLEDKTHKEVFAFLKDNLKRLSKGKGSPFLSVPESQGVSTPQPEPSVAPAKSLKDRIEEARNTLSFPRRAMEVIDKNKVSAVGHSGPKYTELIETLLAIPWGKIQKIRVSAEEFEKGLNLTHYGLKRPKEIICDFFANLIWRYQQSSENEDISQHRTGSAFLFVGPAGVGKTSLAISIANNLGIAYHKISLGGMRDEADLKGHGFTYEGSKPGAIVQGLIKMGITNGIIIMDEADKTEKFAISTLLEILDPEQNHLFHDKYTQTTVDIDLSNCHFILTANTLETVPPTVVNRCEVVVLDRYSVDEKVDISRQHLVGRVRQRYQISEDAIFFDSDQEPDLLRHLIKTYTYEPGVRELERVIRRLFLRILRKEILARQKQSVRITREKIKQYLESPVQPRQINDESRVGEILALGVNVERGVGSIIPIQATRLRLRGQSENRREGYLSMVHATGNIQKIMDESRKVATTGILHCADDLGIDLDQVESPIHLHFTGASTPKDGPSAGGAIGIALASALSDRTIRRDVAMTGEIDTKGRITKVGGLDIKLETAYDAGCKTILIPKENLRGDEGIERLPDALKKELQIFTYEKWKGGHEPFDYERHMLQVVAVDHIVQAADVAFIDEEELVELETRFIDHAHTIDREIERARKDPANCFRLFYTKDPGELDLEGVEESFWKDCKCVLLSHPEVKETILANFPALEKHIRFRNFDPSREDLTTVIREIQKSLTGDSDVPLRVSLVAPFFFLKRDGISPENFSPDLSSEELRLFANNYTVQGVKIKTCKSVLNHVYCNLAQLESTHADACFFLGERNGIYAVDLSFIPEKYRLDVKHAEEILNLCLKEWLIALEGSDQD